jgi:hypothetical protein
MTKMPDDRLSSPARVPPSIGKIGSWLLIIPSTILAILAVELFSHVFLPPGTIQSFEMRRSAVFFDGRETIFRNQGDIFTYVPDSEIRNVTAFFPPDNDFQIEYDYRFRTNNFGLVQDADIVPERESLLLLGDSFTEGQGAEPWFRSISGEVDKLGFQPINGGLMGTGFSQWLKLERYLVASKVQIRKIVVLYIAGDYSRRVWNFTTADLQCLSNLSLCSLDDSIFFRLPPPNELSSWIAKLRTARAPMAKKSGLGAQFETLLPASYSVYEYVSGLSARVSKLIEVGQESRAAVAELIRMYGPGNVAFIHLPEKIEVEKGGLLGLNLRQKAVEELMEMSIEAAGGKVFDGLKLCQLTTMDYHVNDPHPNSAGYSKIASCTTNVIKEMMARGR